MLDSVTEIVAQIRRAKTEAKVSQRASVERLVISAPVELYLAIKAGTSDISDAGSVLAFELDTGPDLRCDIALAPQSAEPPASR